MASRGGKLVPIVQEYVLNTYTRSAAFDVKAADDYWGATKDYWAQIRAQWDALTASGNGIAVEEFADTGTVISGRLLELADEIQQGKTTTARAMTEARALFTAKVKKL